PFAFDDVRVGDPHPGGIRPKAYRHGGRWLDIDDLATPQGERQRHTARTPPTSITTSSASIYAAMTARVGPSGRSGSAFTRGWSAGQAARLSHGGCGPRSRVRCASTASTRAAYRLAALLPLVAIVGSSQSMVLTEWPTAKPALSRHSPDFRPFRGQD